MNSTTSRLLLRVLLPILFIQPVMAQAAALYNESCYLQRNPDVVTGWVQKGKSAYDHWMQYGHKEGRIPDCRGMTPPPIGSAPPGHSQPVSPAPPSSPSPSPVPSGSENTIVGPGGNPVQISVDSDRFGGAVASLRWNNVEFINSHDHGRQLQTAVQYDGYAECNNPTEAGSSHDRSKSTSRLLSQSKTSASQLSNQIQMAYWSYGKVTGACQKGLDPRIKSPLSNTILSKKITIGAFGDPQIVDYSISIAYAKGDATSQVIYELLTGYLNSEFKRFFFVTQKTGKLNEYLGSELRDISGNGFPAGSYLGQSPRKQKFDPVILSNPSGSHAMGAYISPGQITACGSDFGYGIFHFNLGGSGPKGAGTNKWNMAAYDSANNRCIVNGKRSFKVFLAVGTLADVHAKIARLIKVAP